MSSESKGRFSFRNIVNTLNPLNTPSEEATRPSFLGSYKPSEQSQIDQVKTGDVWWRDFDYGDLTGNTPVGSGQGFTVYPFVSVWERIWGAVPMDDYQKYKQYYVQEPFIHSTIDNHVFTATEPGFKLKYPLENVVRDFMEFFKRHGFFEMNKILMKDMFLFGNAYFEVVRIWTCGRTDHDMNALVVSRVAKATNGTYYWWTNRMEVAQKHNQLYPEHVLDNPKGEITRLVPLDCTYMRVRRDEHGSLAPSERIIFYDEKGLQIDTIGEYVSKLKKEGIYDIKQIDETTNIINKNYFLPTITEENKAQISHGPHLLEHHYKGNMYKVYTRGGRVADVTGNHSIFLWEPNNPHHNVKDGRQILKAASDIKVGDYVVVSKSLPIPKEQALVSINVAKLFVSNLPYEKLRWTKVIDDAIPEIIEKYRKPILTYLMNTKNWSQQVASSSLSHMKSSRTLSLDIVKECDIKEAFNCKFVSSKKTTKYIPNIIEDTSSLLYAMGMLIAEGGLATSSKGDFIYWTGDSAHLIKSFLDAIGVSYSYKIKKTSGSHLYINYKQCPVLTVYNKPLFEVFNILFNNKSEQIPLSIFALPLSQLKHFIGGMWQGDGWHSNTPVDFEYYTSNKRLAEDLIMLLARFNIFGYLRTRDDIKEGKRYISYSVTAYLNKVNPLNWDETLIQELGQVSVNDVVLSKVTNIEKYEYDGPVYDFEVDDTHAFLNNSLIKLKNTILGYAQYYVAPIISFLADEVIHLRYSPTSWTYESVYGVSMLRSIMFHQELIKNYEQIVGQIMNVYLKPLFIVRVGGDQGVEVTSEQYNDIKRAFATRKPGTDLVFRSSAPVTLEPINPPIERIQSTEFWLQWLHSMRSYALIIPKFLVDPAGLNRATSSLIQEAYFTFINSARKSYNAQIEPNLFPMIMYTLYGPSADEIMHEYGVPEIVWNPIKTSSQTELTGIASEQYTAGIANRNEARELLGYLPEIGGNSNVFGPEGGAAQSSSHPFSQLVETERLNTNLNKGEEDSEVGEAMDYDGLDTDNDKDSYNDEEIEEKLDEIENQKNVLSKHEEALSDKLYELLRKRKRTKQQKRRRQVNPTKKYPDYHKI